MEEENEVVKTFAELGVREELVKACDRLGWKDPSKIQAEALIYALEGKDVIGLAQTGSGKTGAFALPILQALLEYVYDSEPKKDPAFFACVLSPTRELAIQIAEQFEALGSDISLRCAVLVGGIDRMQQTIALGKRPQVIVATPGCLWDHMCYTKGFSLKTLKYLVLDEADRLLNEDFEKSLNQILEEIPRERKTFLFSATMTKKVRKLQRACLRNPVKMGGETDDDGIEDEGGDSMMEDDEGENEEEETDSEEEFDEGENKDGADGKSKGFEDGNDEESESSGEQDDDKKDAEMEELEREYMELRSQEQDTMKNLKRDKGEDAVKGQAVKNQKALWDRTLEFRFLLQKSFSNSNRLPQEPVKSSFCLGDENVSTAYTDLITSSKKTLDSLLVLQKALLEKNPSVDQQVDESQSSEGEDGDEWQQISDLQKRMSLFRNKGVDKWQRRTQVTTGAAAIKGKLHAFNQNVSEQVASYMRDPSRMIKQMQQSTSTVAVFGTVPTEAMEPNQEEKQCEGDPELVEDAEFYQQLLKEFFQTIDPASSEAAFYAMKKFQTKKRKVVDRRASKSRKIRYNFHEKIVNFMAPRPAKIPPNTADLLKNLFGLKTRTGLSEA